MLIPTERLCTLKDPKGNVFRAYMYYVYDTDKKEIVENKTFSFYNTMSECQEAINFYNSLSIV